MKRIGGIFIISVIAATLTLAVNNYFEKETGVYSGSFSK